MSTLTLRFPPGSSHLGGLDSLAKTLQACSKVAATLEHGQRLQNLSERLFFIQKPSAQPSPDLDLETQPLLDLSSSGRPRRTSSTPTKSSKRNDLSRKSQTAVKLSSIFNDDFSPTALLSPANSNTVEIPLDELFAPDATSPTAAKPSAVQAVPSKRTAAPPKKSTSVVMQTSPGTSVNAVDITGVNGKAMCANCGATHTPLWRRGLNDELNCNACGLYCKLHKRPRPKVMKIGSAAAARPQAYVPPPEVTVVSAVCYNCQTTTTPLWRKSEAGQNVCNACGLYYKLHGEARPVSMKSDVVRKRSRQESASRSPKPIPLPTQREYTKPSAGLKVNTTPISYERSSSLSAGATPRKRSFASDDDEDEVDGRRRQREGDVVGLKLSELQKLQSTLVDLQRRGEETGRLSSRNSEFGDVTDSEGYGSSDETNSRKRRRSEDDDYEGYDRRLAFDTTGRARDVSSRARLDSSYGRPSPLRQLVDGGEAPPRMRQTIESIYEENQKLSKLEYASERARSPFSASSSASSSPRTVEGDLPMSRPPYSPTHSSTSTDGYYMHSYLSKDINPAYARVPSAYDSYDYRGMERASVSIPRKYRRQRIELV